MEGTPCLAFVGFEKVFDLLARDVRKFWKNEGFKCHVVYVGKLIDSFVVTTGIRQGCVLSSNLFLLLLDMVINKVLKHRKRGIQWRMMEKLEDNDFADEICLLAQGWSDIKAKLEKLEKDATKMGLK
jgi:Reverse transcriptase (RNA-dependent DNA polymerase).